MNERVEKETQIMKKENAADEEEENNWNAPKCALCNDFGDMRHGTMRTITKKKAIAFYFLL